MPRVQDHRDVRVEDIESHQFHPQHLGRPLRPRRGSRPPPGQALPSGVRKPGSDVEGCDLDPLVHQDPGRQGAVKPAGQKSPQRHIAHETLDHCRLQRAANGGNLFAQGHVLPGLNARHVIIALEALSGEEVGFVDDLEKAVEWWNAALLKSNSRNNLRNMEDPLEAVIDLPFLWENEDEWMAVHSIKLQNAALSMRYCNRALAAIDTMKTLAIRNQYRLEVYEQVTNLVRFSGQAMIDLQAYAMAADGLEREEALARLKLYPESFQELRARFEEVYGRTRILHKPEDYKLDQDHHLHMANQSINFDWQFWSEIYFLEKLTEEISNLK